MNGVIRSLIKLPNSSIVGILGRNVKNKLGVSRLFSTLEKTSCKTSVNLIPKTVVSSRENVKNYASESNDAAVQLTKFLEQEISSEEELLGSKTIPSKIDDFEVKLDGSEVTLVKKTPEETIEINFDINRSVQTDDDYDPNLDAANEPPELKSMPDFDIDIKRGDTTLGFSCQYVSGDSGQDKKLDEPEDVFIIDEVTLYTGEYSSKAYSVSGEILDGYLYDLLMNLLDSKGITNEFVMKMSELSTAYEQSSYISLLRALKDFPSK